MRDSTKKMPKTIIGFDLGDRKCVYVVLGREAEELDQGSVLTRKDALHSFFSKFKSARVVLEAGRDSGWISRIIESLGHEAIVAHPRNLRAISGSSNKNDKNDAQILAELGLLQGKLKCITPVYHRSAHAHRCLAILKNRDALVRVRTLLVNHVRSTVKSCGAKIAGCSAHSFAKRAEEQIPEELKESIRPLIEVIRETGVRIREYDNLIRRLCDRTFPQTKNLVQVTGVGYLTALAYVLVLEDPRRFPKSRKVGTYLGLTPGRDQTGNSDPQMPITKCGNEFLRRLLVGSAQYILGPFNTVDSDLKRYGSRICERGGKNAKRRAVVAVARKLAVLLHRLWITEGIYDPLRNSKDTRPSKKGKMVTGSPAA